MDDRTSQLSVAKIYACAISIGDHLSQQRQGLVIVLELGTKVRWEENQTNQLWFTGKCGRPVVLLNHRMISVERHPSVDRS